MASTHELGEYLTRRPRRADAQRNYDALLSAAREVFGESGVNASLEEIARRAGVGIGTLYRNFPSRRELFEAVYVDEVQALSRSVADVAHLPPWDALVAWLNRFVAYAATKRALREELTYDSEVFRRCRTEIYAAGEPLLSRAQQAGAVRPDTNFDDLLRLISGIVALQFPEQGQRDRVLAMALDGLRYPPALA
ncbi:TetR/AcrR family transcriptional regulator [Micromonospora musae]|uniref:TetR/AcrR family transcriptional regulator n=1 Tax=Micromonospora musae TaxID=1894970 RepID=UPI0033F764CD